MKKERKTIIQKILNVSCVKHGRGAVTTWACMAASGTRSILFTDDLTAGKSRMNLKCMGSYSLLRFS